MKKLVVCAFLSITCFIALQINVSAQQVKREVAISAYIYNFAKNVQWPNEAQLKEFNFLIIGQDEKIAQELQNMAKSKTIREKPIRVKTAQTLTDLSNIQLIFLLKEKEESLTRILDQIEGKNILLVTDRYQDKKLIMINFFESGKGTLQFEINKANILNQNLRIMQDMILLGGSEVDVATLYREGQQSLRSLQKNSEELEKELKKSEANLSLLGNSNANLTKEIKNNRDSLDRQSQKIKSQESVLNSQSLLLAKREEEIGAQMQKLKDQQKTYDLQRQEIEKQKVELENGTTKLADMRKEIASQSMILEEQGQKIHRQQDLVYLLGIIIVLVVILVFNIFRSYRNKQRLSKELEIRVADRTAELNDSNKMLLTELSERQQAEKRVIESENKYRVLLENLPQKIFFKNRELAFVSCNENFARELNIASSQIKGKTDYDFFPTELAEKYRKEDFDFLASAKPMDFEISEVRNGRTYWTQVVKIPVKDENGEVIGVQGIFWDITERKSHEDKLQMINEELKLSNSELTILNKVILQSSGQMDVKSLMALAIDEALALTGLEGGTVCSFSENDKLLLMVERNTLAATKDDLQEKVFQVGDCLCGSCVLEKRPLILKNRKEVLEYSSNEALKGEDIQFHAAFPIVTKEKSLGVLCIFTYSDYKPTERSLKLVETLTSQLSLAIENANLYERISRQVENLENLVKDRTAELESKNDHLDRMNKMFVGREIKMAELKKQLAELGKGNT